MNRRRFPTTGEHPPHQRIALSPNKLETTTDGAAIIDASDWLAIAPWCLAAYVVTMLAMALKFGGCV